MMDLNAPKRTREMGIRFMPAEHAATSDRLLPLYNIQINELEYMSFFADTITGDVIMGIGIGMYPNRAWRIPLEDLLAAVRTIEDDKAYEHMHQSRPNIIIPGA